jgi:hypothetical protein
MPYQYYTKTSQYIRKTCFRSTSTVASDDDDDDDDINLEAVTAALKHSSN